MKAPRATVLALLLGLLVPAAFAQTAGETFYENVDVSVVNIEVFVTDRRGKRVAGLTKDDFEVYEDGKRVEITYFHAAEGTGRQPARPGAAGTPEREQLQLAVYFDLQNLPDSARPRLIGAIEGFVTSRARPDEQVLLASYSGPDTLKVRQVAASRPALTAALQEIAGMRKSGLSGSGDGRVIARKLDTAAEGGSNLSDAMAELDQAEIAFSAQARGLRTRAFAKPSLAALHQFLAGLGSLPGRKALLYVSGNITFHPGQSITQAFETKFGRGATAGPLRALVQRVEEMASSDRVLFYALGARDTMARSVISASRAGAPQGSMAGGMGDVVRDITDANPENALEWVDEDLDSYYTLGYTPARRQPGERHKVEVKMKTKGLRVRHLEAYRDRTPRDRAHGRTVAALLFGGDGGGTPETPEENPLGVKVQVGPAEAVEKERATVPVTVRFLLSKIALLPRDGGAQEGSVALFVAARDLEGRASEVIEIRIPVRLSAPPQPGQEASYTTRLALRPIPHTLAIGLRDETGNTVSTVTVPYVPEAPAAAGERR